MDRETLELIDRALAEDVGAGDATTEATVAADARARATITQKAPGVISGLGVAAAVFHRLDDSLTIEQLGLEGQWREAGAPVLGVEGSARALLTAERTALNFLGRLSGVATATARVVQAVRDAGGTARILDTRKTTPGLRALEKQAVAAGGGRNHRMGLDDAILVKDNHIALAGSVAEAVRRALEHRPAGLSVEVECDTLDDVREAIAAGADHLLLDNMTTEELREARALAGEGVSLEASGGYKPGSLRGLDGTGLQFVSLGFLTHSAASLDLALTIEPSLEAF
jgi:nicotinate-nucleotide pyrophosphorylase (carboxylating)